MMRGEERRKMTTIFTFSGEDMNLSKLTLTLVLLEMVHAPHTLTMTRKSILLLVALTILAISGATAERAFTTSSSSRLLSNDNKYDHHSTIVDNFNINDEFDDESQVLEHFGRRLQSSSSSTSRTSGWQALKESLGLTIFGFILICLTPCLVWKNEGRHVRELRRIDFCKNKAVVVPNVDLPSDDNIGNLVHFVGTVSVGDDAPIDFHSSVLNITAPLPKALVIKRTCMIYQKFEQSSSQTKNDTFGGGRTTTTTYTVKEDWTIRPQPERLEHLPGESNSRGIWDELVSHSGTPESESATTPTTPLLPPNLPPQFASLLTQGDLTKAPHALSISKAAHVGGFALTKEVILSEQATFLSVWMPVPAELIPSEIEALPEMRKNRYGDLTTVEEGDQPVNGDVLIKYEYVADGFDASFIVQQVLADSDPETGMMPSSKFSVEKGRVLDEKACFKDDLGVIWMVRLGRHDLHDMIKLAKEDEAMITKALRIICWIMLVAGWSMIFSLLKFSVSIFGSIFGSIAGFAFLIVGLVLGTTCCCGFTALAYIRYRPLIAFLIIAVSGSIAGIIVWQVRSAGAEPSPIPSSSIISPSFFDVSSSFVHLEHTKVLLKEE